MRYEYILFYFIGIFIFGLFFIYKSNRLRKIEINKFANKKSIDISITYADNLEIVDKLNAGEKYDAVWSSNSIWSDMLASPVLMSSILVIL